MNWKDVGKAVATVAPVLGGALAGPMGAAAGTLLAGALGVENSPGAVSEKLGENPDAARTVELQHIQALRRLEVEETRAVISDVQDARRSHSGHWMPWVLTAGLWIMVAGVIGAMCFVAIPPGNSEVLYMLVGQIVGAFSTAIAYWLGSSRGSAEKQAVLSKVVR